MKETSGHKSDAVDQYQITGHDQRQMISNVLQGNSEPKQKSGEINNKPLVERQMNENCVITEAEPTKSACSCGGVNSTNINEIVMKLLENTSKKGKTVLKFEIEFYNE